MGAAMRDAGAVACLSRKGRSRLIAEINRAAALQRVGQ
jgi:hypothetical protein